MIRLLAATAAVAVLGFSGVWGTLATGLFAVPLLAKNLGTGTGGLFYTGSFHQLGIQALGLVTVGIARCGRALRRDALRRIQLGAHPRGR